MNKKTSFGAAFMAALFLFSGTAYARGIEPLYLYAPPSKGGYGGRQAASKQKKPDTTIDHSSHDHGEMKKKKKEENKKPSGRLGYGDSKKGLKKHEPGMRPTPKRSYILSDKGVSDKAETFLMRPDGTMGEAFIVRDKGQLKVEFENPMGDGPAHGANNVYVIDKKVENNTLVVRTAKWINIHHSCGWGHDYRYDNQRNSPKALATIPLEINFDRLWSGNMHASILSGEVLNLEILNYGKPAAGAKISITTQENWTKNLMSDKDGKASFRLIEDYFSDDWGKFKRRNAGAFTVVASFDAEESGEYDGQSYNKISMVSSFHWKYNPAKIGYESYSAGLYAGIFTIGIGGLGIYFHRLRRKNSLEKAGLDENF